jgi:hypothetical protein
MHTAVVAGAVIFVFQVLGLRVGSQKRVVFIGFLGFERSQRLGRGIRSHDLSADEPIRAPGGLALAPLFNQRTKHIGEMLVQSARFFRVDQIAGVGNHAVGQFMAHYIY